jgi:RsiW-degrading membrane proteinase PrsW (M82 family)
MIHELLRIITLVSIATLIATSIYIYRSRKETGSLEMVVGAILMGSAFLLVTAQYFAAKAQIWWEASQWKFVENVFDVAMPLGLAIFSFGFFRFSGLLAIIRGRNGV